jgi:tetratricopeptide (TPR) repeat protein
VDGYYNQVQPEFYVAPEFADQEPELIGSDTLGKPIEYLRDSDDQESDLTNRVAVIRLFLRGLSYYIKGRFSEAGTTFEEALKIEPAGLEVINIFAGNAAVRGKEFDKALAMYDAALVTRPHYARALSGRGIVMYQMADQATGDSPAAYDPALTLPDDWRCGDLDRPLPDSPQLLALLSIRCYEEAVASPDQPDMADVDIKTTFGLGQVNLWLTNVLGADRGIEATAYLQQVIGMYDVSTPERQARTRFYAANAYAYLGLYLITIDGTNPDAVRIAVHHYTQAIDLLKADISRKYNQEWIDIYQKQIDVLNRWLSYQPTATPG